MVVFGLGAAETVIPQGANVAPNGDRLEVTSKCLRLNGKAIIPVMGEMHYSRIPRNEWAHSLATGTTVSPVKPVLESVGSVAFYRAKVSTKPLVD